VTDALVFYGEDFLAPRPISKLEGAGLNILR